MPGSASASVPQTVVHVLSAAERGDAAQVRTITALAGAIDPARYRLKAWILEGAGALRAELAEAGVSSRVINFRRARDLGGALRLAKAVRTDRPAVLHLHVGGRARLWLLRSLSSAKLIVHLWGAYGEDGQPLRLEHSVRSADAAIATSKAVAKAAGPGAIVLYPGVEVPESDGGGGPEAPVIGTAARLEPVKDLSTLVKAAARLLERHPELRVQIAGEGSCEPRLRRVARELGIGEATDFLGWRGDVDRLHPGWSVFAVPSLHEGFPIAAMEAMASGLPVVGTATDGLPELVEDGETGFLVPVGDAESLADRLGLLLSDNGLRRRMGAAARRRIAERFSLDRMAGATIQVYDHALRPDQPRR